MIFDKLRNRYSFNFLVICGWICFVLFLVFTCPEIYITYIVGKSDHFWDVTVTLIGLILFDIAVFFISFIMFFVEKFFDIKNINNKLFENKSFQFLQTVGIIFAITPIVLFCIEIVRLIILSFKI